MLTMAVTARSSLSRCLALANTVADERHQVYVEFVTSDGDGGNKLGDYLEQVRQAALGSLDKGGNAFGFEL